MDIDLSKVQLKEFRFDSKNLSNKVAIITGGGRGIGKELALILSHMGVKVVIAEISEEGKNTLDEIRQSEGKGLYIKTDVSSEDSVKNMLEKVIETFGRIDILVNNAILCPVKAVKDMSIEEWDRVVGVNLRGAFLCINGALKHMECSKNGTIVNMISAPSMPYLTAYITTKNALEALSHSLTGELRNTGISVIAFGPGMVDTPGGRAAFEKLAPLYEMSYEEFTKNGMNKGYYGLIPSYDSALALSYVIANASKYSGETILAVDIIEKLKSMTLSLNSGSKDSNLKEIPETLEFLKILDETLEEQKKFPFFVRPMVKNGFRKKVGISIEEIREYSKKTFDILKSNNELSDNNISFIQLLIKHLKALENYYIEAPVEAKRFIKSEDDYKRVVEISNRRKEVTETLEKTVMKLLNSDK